MVCFIRREHKEVFAYNTQVACDKHGWALAYTVESGNIHDSQGFPGLFAKLEAFSPEFIIADSSYKTPSIAKFLLEKELHQFSLTLDQEVRKIFYVQKTLSMTSIFYYYLCPEN